MIVWGGSDDANNYLDTGGRYNPMTDMWTATSSVSPPEGRLFHTAVWTGSQMIVWGGRGPQFLNSGAKYDPLTDIWTPTSATGVPAPRFNHKAVWTDSEMIVWGGYFGTGLNTGARYNPVTDTWVATSTTNAPSGRLSHSAVWIGTRDDRVWRIHIRSEFQSTGFAHAWEIQARRRFVDCECIGPYSRSRRLVGLDW